MPMTCTPVPAMWQIPTWPPDVFPFTSSKARALIKDQDVRAELVRCGALVRPGQQLLVMGAPYLSWLQKQSARVDAYDPAANRSRNADGTFPKAAQAA